MNKHFSMWRVYALKLNCDMRLIFHHTIHAFTIFILKVWRWFTACQREQMEWDWLLPHQQVRLARTNRTVYSSFHYIQVRLILARVQAGLNKKHEDLEDKGEFFEPDIVQLRQGLRQSTCCLIRSTKHNHANTNTTTLTLTPTPTQTVLLSSSSFNLRVW